MLKPFHHSLLREAGCDEAGRGCYAGPVFAAAVVLPMDFYHPLLNDSKQVPPETRTELRTFIEIHALDYAVASVSNEEIDRINILRASFKAMHLALKKLKNPPEFLLIDGHLFQKYKKIPHLCVIKGDGIYASIAAASILAKTYRDAYMQRLHKKFPHYNWYQNKGYGTPEHRRGIEEHGLCPYHRQSFRIAPGANGEWARADEEQTENEQAMNGAQWISSDGTLQNSQAKQAGTEPSSGPTPATR